MTEQSNGKAIASLVLGILGIVFCPIICSIPAIIMGKEFPDDGMAKAGVILGWIGIALGVLYVVLMVGMMVFGVGMAAVSGQ